MAENPRMSVESRVSDSLEGPKPSQDRELQNFRYVVASVNDSALAVWADLWNELRGNEAAQGAICSADAEGFKPACGWPEFFEKFWLLKHYLDYIHRFCQP